MSASTAVRHKESIGISPVFICFYCLLNSLVISKPKKGLGTANRWR